MLLLHKVQCAAVFKRPDHADLVYIESNSPRLFTVDAEEPQRFHEIEVCLTRCHDAEARIRYVKDFSVNGVGRSECERRHFFGFKPFLDLRSGQIRPAVMQPARRHDEIFGNDELPVWRQFD